MLLKKTIAAVAMFAALGALTNAAAQDKRVGEIIHSEAKYSTLAKAIDAAGLTGMLTGSEELTVLAPTDEAFAKLPTGTLDHLLKPENKDELAALLKRHLVIGNLDQYELKRQRELDTVGGEKLTVKLVGGGLRIADARVLGRQAIATNGIVQPMDAVITK